MHGTTASLCPSMCNCLNKQNMEIGCSPSRHVLVLPKSYNECTKVLLLNVAPWCFLATCTFDTTISLFRYGTAACVMHNLRVIITKERASNPKNRHQTWGYTCFLDWGTLCLLKSIAPSDFTFLPFC